jgi:hypothetical protein
MKTLRTRLTAVGPVVTAVQKFQHFINLPSYLQIMTWSLQYTTPRPPIDLLCERFRAIELRKELRTTEGGTSEAPDDLLAKQKGPRARGGSNSAREWRAILYSAEGKE